MAKKPPHNTLTNPVTILCSAAGRIEQFAQEIITAHEFGTRPGTHQQPWDVEFHRQATEIYSSVLPWWYLCALADTFANVANYMAFRTAPADSVAEWSIVYRYLWAVHTAITDAAPAMFDQPDDVSFEFTSHTPGVMPFAQLAELVTNDGALRLRHAAATIRRAAEHHLSEPNPLTPSERKWLQQLARGVPVSDIAATNGVSSRTLHRRLDSIWTRLGADNRSTGIARAIQRKWINGDESPRATP